LCDKLLVSRPLSWGDHISGVFQRGAVFLGSSCGLSSIFFLNVGYSSYKPLEIFFVQMSNIKSTFAKNCDRHWKMNLCFFLGFLLGWVFFWGFGVFFGFSLWRRLCGFFLRFCFILYWGSWGWVFWSVFCFLWVACGCFSLSRFFFFLGVWFVSYVRG